jgi:transcriptional regulator with XRE-family HTH domain
LGVEICRRLGRNLRRFRLEKGWSQEGLAFEAQIHRTYISDLEQGALNPTISIIDTLAKTLGVKAGALLD